MSDLSREFHPFEPAEAAARLIVARSRIEPRPVGERAVVGFAGYPFTGKTSLAELLTYSVGQGVRIPTESVISDRDSRADSSLDGCSAQAHDLDALATAISALRVQGRATIAGYSWQRGRRVGERAVTCPPDGVIVIDGSVAAEPRVAELCDHLFFFIPTWQDWFQQAVQRDVDQRAWSAEMAHRLNVQKAATVSAQLAAVGGSTTMVAVTRGEGGAFLYRLDARDLLEFDEESAV